MQHLENETRRQGREPFLGKLRRILPVRKEATMSPEELIGEALQSEVFGEKQFNVFMDQMILLVGQKNGYASWVTVVDEKEKKSISFMKEKRSNVRSAGVMAVMPDINEIIHEFELEFPPKGIFDSDNLSYRLHPMTRKRHPYIESQLHGDYTRHNSYVAGDMGEVSNTANGLSVKKEFLSGDDVAIFCQKVYKLYQESQNLPQSQPQNTVG